MPFYTFQCEECETTFDVRASIQERDAGLQPPCPKCTSRQVQPVITAGLLLVGHATSSRPAVQTCACGTKDGRGCCG
jgi:putative FmdB family regulatory protein